MQKKILSMAVCLLAVLCLTAQKTSKKPTVSLSVGQSLTIEGLKITLTSNGLQVMNENDSTQFIANLGYERCYAINPGIFLYPCREKKIPFKDTTSQKVVLRLELPGERIEKIILYPKKILSPISLGDKAEETFSPAFFVYNYLFTHYFTIFFVLSPLLLHLYIF